MRVESVELRVVEMPLRFPFETSFGREEVKRCLLVAARSDGLTGWGEVVASPAPLYNEETIETAWHVLRDFLIPIVCSEEIEDPNSFSRRASHIRRNHMAKAGLEAALWDLYCQREGVTLAQAVGGERTQVEVGVSLGIEHRTADLLNRIEAFLTQGYRRVKIKIKPGYDVPVVREVRRAFPHLRLQVDANSAYTLEDAALFEAMDEYDLLLIEQPLAEDDIVDHAKLQARLRTSVCLDESIVHPHDARKAIELGSCRVVNIKQGRMGGLTRAVKTHDLCESHGVPVWCGGMLETGIGRLLNLALAALPNFRLPGDISASDRYFERDLIDPPVELNPDGTIDVPSDIGIAPRVDRRRVEEVTLRRQTFP
ncbi:MAG: o-succinylbenzoate synthase [Armatimonadota bacterium]|nr:o-succinylbenzoate synthase [Armatimonadota bacterium]MDR5696185.1 o-succinylbenzoate synthase [Armatimonadota bacterium]